MFLKLAIVLLLLLLLLLLYEFNLIRRYKGDSINNFILTARASAHLLLHSLNNSRRKEDARTRNEEHIYLIETPKRGVTSRDWSLGREQ